MERGCTTKPRSSAWRPRSTSSCGSVRSPQDPRGDADTEGKSSFVSVPSCSLVDDFRVGEQHIGKPEQPQIAHAHRVKDAVQVIDLMLHDPGVKSGCLALNRSTVRVEPRVA